MKNHVKIYLKHFNYGIDDVIPCERCGDRATDIHHIYGRGKDRDVVSNLMALCRPCHSLAHSSITKAEMQEIHEKRLKT
jgi:hypothetical protein